GVLLRQRRRPRGVHRLGGLDGPEPEPARGGGVPRRSPRAEAAADPGGAGGLAGRQRQVTGTTVRRQLTAGGGRPAPPPPRPAPAGGTPSWGWGRRRPPGAGRSGSPPRPPRRRRPLGETAGNANGRRADCRTYPQMTQITQMTRGRGQAAQPRETQATAVLT